MLLPPFLEPHSKKKKEKRKQKRESSPSSITYQNEDITNNKTHPVSRTLEMRGTSEAHILPNGNQLNDDSAQISKCHSPSNNTTTESWHSCHPRLLQSPAQTQHQEVDHPSHFEHPENLLMSFSVTTQEDLLRKHLAVHKLTTINAVFAEHTQQCRASSLTGHGQLTRSQTIHNARQPSQFCSRDSLTGRFNMYAHTE